MPKGYGDWMILRPTRRPDPGLMPGSDIVLAVGGAVCLALAAVLWAVSVRRHADARIASVRDRLNRLEGLADATLQASAEAFDSAMLTIEDGEARLAWGGDGQPGALRRNPWRGDIGRGHGRRRRGRRSGAPSADRRPDARRPGPSPAPDRVDRKGRGLRLPGTRLPLRAWSRSTAAPPGPAPGCACKPQITADGGLPPAARFAALLDALPSPAWVCTASGSLIWANLSYLRAVDAASREDAVARRLSFDRGASALIGEAAEAWARARQALRWAPVGGQRRAFQVTARPLEGGDVGAWALDVTDTEDARESLKRHIEAHDETLNHLVDAVAIFDAQRRLSFHNTAFGPDRRGLEPAWLAEHPTHAEVLDRLRQRRRLPETMDYSRWKADELAWYETLGPAPDDLWALPDGRTLRVVRQPHPLGGLLLLFTDMTGDIRLRTQYNGPDPGPARRPWTS